MKKIYEKIELEIIELSVEDVIRTSLSEEAAGGGGFGGGPFLGGGGNGNGGSIIG